MLNLVDVETAVAHESTEATVMDTVVGEDIVAVMTVTRARAADASTIVIREMSKRMFQGTGAGR
jgi:hypothetical protein